MLLRRRAITLIVFITIASFLTVVPGITVKAATPDAPQITSVACTLTVSFNATRSTNYRVQIFDDGVKVYDQTQAGSQGQLLTFTYTFATIGKKVPGVGISVYENSSLVFEVDPYTAIDESCTRAQANGKPVVRWCDLYYIQDGRFKPECWERIVIYDCNPKSPKITVYVVLDNSKGIYVGRFYHQAIKALGHEGIPPVETSMGSFRISEDAAGNYWATISGGPHNANGQDSWAKGGNCGYTGTVTGPSTVGSQPVVRGGPVHIHRVYVVRKGDTVFAIAAHFGVDPMAIAQLNGIVDLDLIYTGERLFIP